MLIDDIYVTPDHPYHLNLEFDPKSGTWEAKIHRYYSGEDEGNQLQLRGAGIHLRPAEAARIALKKAENVEKAEDDVYGRLVTSYADLAELSTALDITARD